MAVGGSDVIKDISENLLYCDVCREPFESHSRPPKILSCFHTFCGVCLDKLVQSSKVKCPLCRLHTVVKGKIPLDPTRSALLDKIRAVDSQGGIPCEACDRGVTSQYRCQDCEEFICEECFNAHQRVKQTRNHTVVSLTEAAQDPSKFVKSIEYCSRHPDMKLDMYCETCKLSVCTKCAFVMHKEGHQIKEVETVVEKKKEEVLSFCKELQQMVPTFQAKLEKSQASLQQGKDNVVAAEEKIKTAISEIINAAKKREAELLEKLRSLAKTDQLTLEEQVATFSSKLSAAQTTSGHGGRLVSMNLTTHILEQTQHIDKMTKDLKKDLRAPVEAAPTYEVKKTRTLSGVEETVKRYVELGERPAKRGDRGYTSSFPVVQEDACECYPGQHPKECYPTSSAFEVDAGERPAQLAQSYSTSSLPEAQAGGHPAQLTQRYPTSSLPEAQEGGHPAQLTQRYPTSSLPEAQEDACECYPGQQPKECYPTSSAFEVDADEYECYPEQHAEECYPTSSDPEAKAAALDYFRGNQKSGSSASKRK